MRPEVVPSHGAKAAYLTDELASSDVVNTRQMSPQIGRTSKRQSTLLTVVSQLVIFANVEAQFAVGKSLLAADMTFRLPGDIL